VGASRHQVAPVTSPGMARGGLRFPGHVHGWTSGGRAGGEVAFPAALAHG
jgi:hypothetical protein